MSCRLRQIHLPNFYKVSSECAQKWNWTFMVGDTIPPLHVEKESTKIYAKYFGTRPIFHKKKNWLSCSSKSIDWHSFLFHGSVWRNFKSFVRRYIKIRIFTKWDVKLQFVCVCRNSQSWRWSNIFRQRFHSSLNL